jgi:hypothetical protein
VSKLYKENKGLYNWRRTLKSKLHSGQVTVSDEQMQRLVEIGFFGPQPAQTMCKPKPRVARKLRTVKSKFKMYEPSGVRRVDKRWIAMLNKMIEFKAEFGHCRVPPE